jgi:hypothetical protein
MLPADSGVQHKEDPLQRDTVIERLPTRIAKTPLLPGQQRLDPLHNPFGTSHRFDLIETLPRLTTGADRLR